MNFRTRPGGTINGVEYGTEGGSFGYLNNYMTAGQKVGNFEASLFASDARGNGFIQNSWFNSQTVNFLATLKATPDDRLTFKLINNDVFTRLPLRLSLNQYNQNPFQSGCEVPGTLGCGTVSLFNNGFNGAKTPLTAIEAGLGRDDRRTIVGGRWEHDFDNTTSPSLDGPGRGSLFVDRQHRSRSFARKRIPETVPRSLQTAPRWELPRPVGMPARNIRDGLRLLVRDTRRTAAPRDHGPQRLEAEGGHP